MTREQYLQFRPTNHHPLLCEYYCEIRGDMSKIDRQSFYDLFKFWTMIRFTDINRILTNIIAYYDSKFGVITIFSKSGEFIKAY